MTQTIEVRSKSPGAVPHPGKSCSAEPARANQARITEETWEFHMVVASNR